ncbi:capsular polysaccharide biosynthesis protein-like protein, partial [Cupriavidus sp. HMR-1]|uniref:glycosyltransferase 61 family protein n=1 Tax=Cupriavidus sp. HMR-1 TaxID=1249621 RepID=UPI0002A2076A
RFAGASSKSPSYHYTLNGRGIAFDPLPLFDSEFYAAQLRGCHIPVGMTLLDHYLAEGAAQGFDPSPLFSTSAYLMFNPDVAAAGVNPLEHFVKSGEREGRRWFDSEAPEMLAIARGVLNGDQGNRYARWIIATRLSYFIDEAYYRSRHGVTESPLAHYVNHGGDPEMSPHPMFDARHYRMETGLNELPTGVTWIEHFLTAEITKRQAPSLLFDQADYLAMNPDVAMSGVDPFEHFVRWGEREGRFPISLERADLEARILQVLTEVPNHPYALRLWIECLLARGEGSGAVAALNELEDKLPRPLLENLLGQALQQTGNIDAAVTSYSLSESLSGTDALHIDANVASVLAREGYRAEMRGELKIAEASYRMALTKGLKEAQLIRERLANLVFASGDRDMAMNLLAARAKDGSTRVIDMPLTSVTEHCAQGIGRYFELFPERPIEPIEPEFLRPPTALESESGTLTAPPFYLAVLDECTAASRCNVVLHQGTLVSDQATHPRSGKAVFGDRLNEHQVIRARHGGNVLIEWPTKESLHIPCGLMMFGVQSRNFGHWGCEYLPRLLAYDSLPELREFPIIVDSGMPKTHLESLSLLNEFGREVITLEPEQVVTFGQLAMAPVPTYFPLDGVGGYSYDAVWPRDVLRAMKEMVLKAVERRLGVPARRGRRLFISRHAFASRQMLNEAEVRSMLTDHGFETIYPEEMSFIEQVDTFRSASMVVGSCSSALSNTLYCPDRTPVIGLIHDEPSFNFRGYSSYSDAGGASILFVQSPVAPGQHAVHAFHRSYSVDTAVLRAALIWAERRGNSRAALTL